MFGGKGKFIEYYQSGDDLFEIMCALESELGIKAFFVMDENFLIDKKRALQLLARMEENNKPWSLYVFSSANVLQKYTMEQLVALGVSWVWMGLEGKGSQYTKLAGTDTVAFTKNLRDHGIRVLGSSIIGLEEHTPENIDEAIENAVSHKTEFHQFMLYTPIPGTPLFAEHEADNSLKSLADVSIADIHGQHVFNYNHPHIKDGQETELLLRAFGRDFEVNGPSIVRIIRNRAARLEEIQESSRCENSSTFCPRSGEHLRALRLGAVGDSQILPGRPRASGRNHRATARTVRRMRLEVEARCSSWRALHVPPTPQARKNARRWLDLRAAHLLRDQFC